MNQQPEMTRRSFCKLVGGGIVMLVAARPATSQAQGAQFIYPSDFNAYLHIDGNGTVTVYSGKIEMGQGVMTSQAQMAAEELDLPLASIRIVLGDTDRCPVDMGTFGSLTTRMFGPVLRAAAAQARLTLMKIGSEHLDVPIGRIATQQGMVYVVDAPERRLSYGELSKGAAITEVIGYKAVLRSAKDFQVMGKSPDRFDALEKVTGAAKYAADIRTPGMLYARILRPPHHGAVLSRADTSSAEKVAGVLLVRKDDLIAVLHQDPETAGFALGLIKTDWKLSPSDLTEENIHAYLVDRLTTFTSVTEHGDINHAKPDAARLFETRYTKAYVAHAPIEPHAALAEFKDGKLTVWASTQTPFPTRDRIARTLGLKQDQVRVITPFVGGGFGGKSADNQAVEAAQLAQITGKPVQVNWTRAEEFFYDRFDPASVVDISSGLSVDGKILFWDQAVRAAGERGAACVYDVPHVRIRSAGQTPYGAPASTPSAHPFATGPWRAPGSNMNVFAIESQIDAMAASIGADPLAFRLANLSDTRMQRVLQAVADAFGWNARKRVGGTGYGLACNVDAGTYVATMVEVLVDRATGRVSVVRVVCAQDMGIVVNPEGAKMQIEGGITMGLGYALSEALRFRGGDILDRNFDTYNIPRFSWVPRIESILVKNDEIAPQGGGEPPITTVGAVLGNAIFDATRARISALPITPERLSAAIASLNPVLQT
jgi:isoquinoline 1-oxidoreductase